MSKTQWKDQPRVDVYQMVTDRIIAAIEKDGLLPWRKPWREVATLGQTRNAISNRPYHGMNALLTAMAGYADPRWLTFNQAKALGGMVRKGEKGTPIIFWKFIAVEDKSNVEKSKKIPLLRYFTVFNVSQCDNLPAKFQQPIDPSRPSVPPIDAAEAVVREMVNPPSLVHGCTHACYSPMFDVVNMPNRDDFTSAEHYYATLFHEFVHSTGHTSRLDRGLDGTFGSDPYAREELIAEMGAAFLCADVGIDATLDQSAAYVQSWLKRLKNDKKLIVTAASAAQRAVTYIHGTADEQTADSTDEGSEVEPVACAA